MRKTSGRFPARLQFSVLPAGAATGAHLSPSQLPAHSFNPDVSFCLPEATLSFSLSPSVFGCVVGAVRLHRTPTPYLLQPSSIQTPLSLFLTVHLWPPSLSRSSLIRRRLMCLTSLSEDQRGVRLEGEIHTRNSHAQLSACRRTDTRIYPNPLEAAEYRAQAADWDKDRIRIYMHPV